MTHVAASVRPWSFPNCRVPCISEPPRQTVHGTNRESLWMRNVMELGWNGDVGGINFNDEIGL